MKNVVKFKLQQNFRDDKKLEENDLKLHYLLKICSFCQYEMNGRDRRVQKLIRTLSKQENTNTHAILES